MAKNPNKSLNAFVNDREGPKENIPETLRDRLTGMRDKFSNFSFGKMFGNTSTTAATDSNQETVNPQRSRAAARNETRAQTVNTAYYTTISEGQHRNLRKGDGLANILAKIYNLLKFKQEEDIQKDQKERNFGKMEESRRRRKRLLSVPTHTKISKSGGKSNEYEDIIELLMPAFKILKGAFEGIKAIFGGILSAISGLFSAITGMFSILYKAIKLVTSGIFKVIGGILSLSKSLLGVVVEIASILTGFLFREIVTPMVKNVMKAVVFLSNQIAQRVVRNAMTVVADALEKIPVIGTAVKVALAAAGLYTTAVALNEAQIIGTKAFIGKEAFDMIEELTTAREHAEGQQRIAENVGPELRRLQEQYNSAPQRDKLAISARIQNLRATRQAYENAAKKAKEEYDVKQGKYNESKDKYIKGLNEKLALLDLKINEDDSLPGKNGERIYGLVETTTGETYNPVTSAATIAAIDYMTPKTMTAEKLKELKDNLIKEVKESGPYKEVEKAITAVEAGVKEQLDTITNGKYLEEISKALKEAGVKVKWAFSQADETNVTIDQRTISAGGDSGSTSVRTEEDTLDMIQSMNQRRMRFQ